MASVLAIGVLCDDQGKIGQAVDYFKNGAGMGSIRNVIPYVYDDQGLAQWQESGRDQGHTILGVGLMGAFCEMAWNQGYDLYGYDNNRFMKACEYVAKYNLGMDVPFTSYTWVYGAPGVWGGSQTFTQVSSASRGQIRPVWETIYNHYAGRRGLTVPYTAMFAGAGRPEGGGGDYGSTSGGFDQLGFGTLAHTRDSAGIASGGTYKLVCERSGKALDNGNTTTDGGQVVQWADNGETPQRWRITDVGGGSYKLVCERSGKALDNGNSATDGGPVVQWADNGGLPQRWRLVRLA
jgi:hypothetical protein